jgi:3-methyladenine DNA glycosylase AlkD
MELFLFFRYDGLMQHVDTAKRALRALATPERALGAERFFKTQKGEYGYGDVFIGVTVPDTRKVARQSIALPLGEIKKLLLSAIHEDRLLGLIILVQQFKKGDRKVQKQIFDLYLKMRGRVNNWDLVDVSAPQIIGQYCLQYGGGMEILTSLASSKVLWQRRMAIVATLAFIRAGSSKECFAIAQHLLDDQHDLIHKAVGWMLREVGKNIGRAEERKFLDSYVQDMPRTALRYALEHFDPQERSVYMKKHAL